MKIDDRYSVSVCADEKMYVDNIDYKNYIAERIQNELSKAIITALCTKDAIVAIKGDSTTRKDESICGIICRQDVYVKELVRCKDCKHADIFHQCDRVKSWTSGDDYCSWGERKESEK